MKKDPNKNYWNEYISPDECVQKIISIHRGKTTNETKLAYLICATPRTGSTLLFDGLMRTGVAGRPDEYFDDRRWVQLAMMTRLGIVSDRTYFSQIVRMATTPNGVCGLRIHGHQVSALHEKILCIPELPEKWLERINFYEALHIGFTDLRFIWLRRKNRVAQAISLFLATRSRVWKKRLGSRAAEPVIDYDFAGIDRLVHRLEYQDLSWQRFFEDHGIQPLQLIYEDFIENYEETIRGVLNFLEVQPLSTAIHPPRLMRQSGERSLLWEKKYKEETAS